MIKGNVTINYTRNGKIREQIKSHNMVFNQAFLCSNWFDFLTQSVTPVLFLTDSTQEPSQDFPYLPGKILGWGQNKATASGMYQGSFSPSQCKLAEPTADGVKFVYAFDFLPSQITEKIGAIGITNQYTNFASFNAINYPLMQMPVKRLLYVPEQACYVYLSTDDYGYSINSNGIVTKYNPKTAEKITLDVSALIGTGNHSIGRDKDGLFYIYKYNGSSSKVYLFADDTFSEITAEYNYTAANNWPSYCRVFLVADGKMFWSVQYWYTANFLGNTSPVANSTFTACPWNNNGMVNTSYLSLMLDGKYGFVLYDYATSSKIFSQIWDLEQNAEVARISNTCNSNNGYYQQAYYENGLIMRSNYYNQQFYTRSAFTHFKVPDDAPERQEGDAISVIYALEVQYR
jgi:hypothetical protein